MLFVCLFQRVANSVWTGVDCSAESHCPGKSRIASGTRQVSEYFYSVVIMVGNRIFNAERQKIVARSKNNNEHCTKN
jgi:hypothetical protein